MKRHLLFLLAGLFFSFNASAQDMVLNMTKEDFVKAFGEPEEAAPGIQTQVILLFYGNDTFIFEDNLLVSMEVMTKRFSLKIEEKGMAVGDSFAPILKMAKDNLELISSEPPADIYRYSKDGMDSIIEIVVMDGSIVGFSVKKPEEEAPYRKEEFEAFFAKSYNPVSVIPDNSPWPGKIIVIWKLAGYSLSKDGKYAVCCAPLVGQNTISARYSEKECPEIESRLVISKMLNGSNIFKQSIISIVPKAGLTPGDPFSGLIVYDNVNSGTCFAWEYYLNGLLAYSKYPTKQSASGVSNANLAIRFNRKVFYVGNQDIVSDEDWSIIASCRLGLTLSFPSALASGQTEESLKSEKDKYSFSYVANPDFDNMMNLVKSAVEKEDPTLQESDTENPAEPETEKTDICDDEPLPAYLGKPDNLSGILWLRSCPLDLKYENRKVMKNSSGTETVLVGINSDYCDYTIMMANGLTSRISPGRSIVKDDFILDNSYSYFKGRQISGIDVKFPYALPVSSGTKVKIISDPREKYRSFAVLMKVGEPVYAMRGGRICLTEDRDAVLICHKDGTFAAYMNVDTPCVKPGDYVYPGDKIGKCGGGRLSFSIFYLDKNKSGAGSGSRYTHITPYIRTEEGDVKLETDKEYVSLTDQDIITKEMSPSEKKRYLKKL